MAMNISASDSSGPSTACHHPLGTNSSEPGPRVIVCASSGIAVGTGPTWYPASSPWTVSMTSECRWVGSGNARLSAMCHTLVPLICRMKLTAWSECIAVLVPPRVAWVLHSMRPCGGSPRSKRRRASQRPSCGNTRSGSWRNIGMPASYSSGTAAPWTTAAWYSSPPERGST